MAGCNVDEGPAGALVTAGVGPGPGTVLVASPSGRVLSLSRWTAALRPRRVNGRFAGPIS